MRRRLTPFLLCASLLAYVSGAAIGGRQGRDADGPTLNLPPLETRVIGQSRWLKGQSATVRVIVTDHRTGKPASAAVDISVVGTAAAGGANSVLAHKTEHTDVLGVVNGRLDVTSLPPGAYKLRVVVSSAIGRDDVEQPIQISQSSRILLSSDKPVYQPGQVMHLRTLALDEATRQAIQDQEMVLEVEDGRANKVMKKRVTLSRFGIAAADFTLADEVNMGLYTIRATLPTGRAERRVRVERYSLPKFRVKVRTARGYYLPGERIRGTVQADYFFGKPVVGAHVALELLRGAEPDTENRRLQELAGTTDAAGRFAFDYPVPGTMLDDIGVARASIQLRARVLDTATHAEVANRSVPVTRSAVDVSVVPQSAELLGGVPNKVFIALATPDGQPMAATRFLAWTKRQEDAEELTTDRLGIAEMSVTPDPGSATELSVRAAPPGGPWSTTHHTLATRTSLDGILLRVDRTVARAGASLAVTAVAPGNKGVIYFDAIRNGQTVMTFAQQAEDGRATITIPLSEDLTGSLEVRAFRILPSDEIANDSRTILVLPSRDLRVDVAADRALYRPGDEATLRFTVRDDANHSAAAALGVAVVDESVFALSELQPGLERVYFLLAKELMQPRYETHGIDTGRLLDDRANGLTEAERQRAAACLFAAAPRAASDIRVNTFQEKWLRVKHAAIEEIALEHWRIAYALQTYRRTRGQSLALKDGLHTLVEMRYLRESDLLDPWQTPYRIETRGASGYQGGFTLASAGPDRTWDTGDDLKGISLYDSMSYRSIGGQGGSRGGGFGGGGFGGGFGGGRGGFGGGGVGGGAFGGMGMGGRGGGAYLGGRGNEVTADTAAGSTTGTNPSAGVGTIPVATPEPSPEPRVRQFFPETLFWSAGVITDEAGRADLRVGLADSITEWRVSVSANSSSGQLGGTTAAVRVFQDFFADVDLPPTLTLHDTIEIPVAVYNYSSAPKEVAVHLAEEPWFRLAGPAERSVKVGRNEVGVVRFPISIEASGTHKLTITARGEKVSDAIRRAVEVIPDGREVESVIGDRLKGVVERTVEFPAKVVPGSRRLLVKLYPGAMSQVLEGLDALFRAPYGCFEQTTSVTYPNVLALAYLKRGGTLQPETRMKAEGYINTGYQRLLTFEVSGGGFSLYGQPRASPFLTAFGLLEFADMAKVHDVDPALIARTQKWLASRPDGEGLRSEDVGEAAFCAWALVESGYHGPEVNAARDTLLRRLDLVKDNYELALVLNFMVSLDPDGAATAVIARRLIDRAGVTAEIASWTSRRSTFTGATETGADLETTALAAYGLARWGREVPITDRTLTYLVRKRTSLGAWPTTHITVWAMKALLAAPIGDQRKPGRVTVFANGAQAAVIDLEPGDEVMRQVDLREFVRPGANTVRLAYAGEGSVAYQIVGRSNVPWEEEPRGRPGPLLDVRYDRLRVAAGEAVEATATVKNVSDANVEAPLIDLGNPAGFTVETDDLDTAVAKGLIARYSVTGRQLIVYVARMRPGDDLTLRWRLRSRFAVRTQIPSGSAYPYYNPERATIEPPRIIEAIR
jgi:hypothetical protein